MNNFSHQKTAFDSGLYSSLTRFVNNLELTLRTTNNIPYLSSVVNSKGVDPTGLEPVRPTFLGLAPKPGGPTPRRNIYNYMPIVKAKLSS